MVAVGGAINDLSAERQRGWEGEEEEEERSISGRRG